jgi:hypothetical protein
VHNNDRLNVIDINRLITLSEDEKRVFGYLVKGNSGKFLEGFLGFFEAKNGNSKGFSLSRFEKQKILFSIKKNIFVNRAKVLFKGEVNPFLEWQLMIQTLVDAGMQPNDFKVDWQLVFRMVALRDAVKAELKSET